MRSSLHHPSSSKPRYRALLPLAIFATLIALGSGQVGNLHAQTPEPAFPDPTFNESEAQTIDRMIMCPVCPAETIDQAQVEISRQMRVIVREMLADGQERDAILDFFVQRYGKDILAAPPKSGAYLVAWLLPIAGVIAALAAVFFIMRSMARSGLRPSPVTSPTSPDESLAPYLQLVDRHLDLTRPGRTSNRSAPAVESLERNQSSLEESR